MLLTVNGTFEARNSEWIFCSDSHFGTERGCLSRSSPSYLTQANWSCEAWLRSAAAETAALPKRFVVLVEDSPSAALGWALLRRMVLHSKVKVAIRLAVR